MQDGDFWFKAAAKMLAPHLLASARAGTDMETLLRWVETQEQAEVVDILERFDEHQALQALSATFSREDRQRSSIYTTVETVLEAYTDPRVLENSRSCDISPARLFDGGSHTLYLCGPANEQERLAPLFGALLEEIAAVAYRSNLELGKPLDPPLLIVGDELANVAPIRSLPQIASTGAGSGIQLISIFQDLAQLQERWGKSWRTIANSHRARLFGTGNGDPETLDYVRRLTGEAAYEQHSDTRGEMGNRSRTDSATYRSIAPANVVREADPGTALLIYGHLPPTTIELRPFFEEPNLRALAGLGAETGIQSPFKRPRRSRAGARSGRR